MDSANEATEQLNRAERFLTEIQDNPEVMIFSCIQVTVQRSHSNVVDIFILAEQSFKDYLLFQS